MKEHRQIRLDARLSAVATSVREGVRLIDVGTDHAYLPIRLVSEGTVPYAVASDIAQGPLRKAREAVREAGLDDRVETVLCDGLSGISLSPPCDIVIAGMGGETIAAILEGRPEVKHPDIRLILQPMTKAAFLRGFLCGNGFSIDSERIAGERKLYPIFLCRYTGERVELSPLELAFGREGSRVEDALFFRYVREKLKARKLAAEGRARAGKEKEEDRLFFEEAARLLEREAPSDRPRT